MFDLVQGDLFQSETDALVNTVNTEGVMGKGIALQFKKLYPENYKAYKKACDRGEVRPGHVFIYYNGFLGKPQYIINFPTKRHWKERSNIEDIRSGLKSLVKEVGRLGIKSVSVPPLGCGLGGLSWAEVEVLMRHAFEKLPEVHWIVFQPHFVIEQSKVHRSRPKMTLGRALIIGLIEKYLVPGYLYDLTLKEIQKLVYFLTETGETLNKVKFDKGHYGPYSSVLDHVLERLDGFFIHGLDSKKPDNSIRISPEVFKEASEYLKQHQVDYSNFNKVVDLVQGFETSYGLELLATVHWVVTKEKSNQPLSDKEVLDVIHKWNTRKASLMNQEDIAIALERLKKFGWIE